MGNTTNGVLMGIAGLLSFIGLAVGNTSDILFALVLLMFTRILQEWNKK